MTPLPTLKARLEEATGPNFTLDCLIGETLDRWDQEGPPPAYTASVDAALELVERKLSDREWAVWRDDENRRFVGQITDDNWDEFKTHYFGKAPTAPLAILTALLSALIAEDEQ